MQSICEAFRCLKLAEMRTAMRLGENLARSLTFVNGKDPLVLDNSNT